MKRTRLITILCLVALVSTGCDNNSRTQDTTLTPTETSAPFTQNYAEPVIYDWYAELDEKVVEDYVSAYLHQEYSPSLFRHDNFQLMYEDVESKFNAKGLDSNIYYNLTEQHEPIKIKEMATALNDLYRIYNRPEIGSGDTRLSQSPARKGNNDILTGIDFSSDAEWELLHNTYYKTSYSGDSDLGTFNAIQVKHGNDYMTIGQLMDIMWRTIYETVGDTTYAEDYDRAARLIHTENTIENGRPPYTVFCAAKLLSCGLLPVNVAMDSTTDINAIVTKGQFYTCMANVYEYCGLAK